MFGWLRSLAERVVARHTQSLAAENRALKARVREAYGDAPVPLTPAERQRLKELRKQISLEDLKTLGIDDDIFDLDSDESRG